MKVKEVDRTANVAWSTASQHPIYLAAGTAAQQLDASFSTAAALEVYALNLTEPGLEMSLKGSLALDHRLNKVVWGNNGMTEGTRESGVLAAGSDNGSLLVYDAAKLINGEEDVEIFQSDKHAGPIYSLDFNPFQNNLMVSGGGESEILIWDLNNPNSPMTPGAKSQPLEEISCVAWNRQVQHILASTFPARCVVWDLRKNEPIIKVSDSTSRLRLKSVAWHPEVATQLCFASEDDHSPVIQLWDLRFATSPLKVLESHQRGVLSIAWCQHDPDLLLSCGKDNRILCWNPNSNLQGGEVVCELPTNNQWSFEVAWCPRNPAVIASSSFDGHVSVYSLMGGQQQLQPSSKIAESFPGSGAFTPPPSQASIPRSVAMPLQKPPKWLRRPVGATFAFGGKLVIFTTEAKAANQVAGGVPIVQSFNATISQVITEPTVVRNATHLEDALKQGTLADFCKLKVDQLDDNYQKMIWNFLHANFEASPRSAMLSLLGYDPQEVATQLEPLVKSAEKNLPENMKDLSISESTLDEDASSTFDDIATNLKKSEEASFEIVTNDGSTEGTLARALLTGNIEAAVELCVSQDQWADALVLAQAGGSQLLQATQKRYLNSVVTSTAKLISAVVSSDWENVVRNCELKCWKEALAAVLTYAKPTEFALLCDTLGKRLEREGSFNSIRNASLCYVCSGNLESLTKCWVSVNDSDITPASLQDLVEQMMILKRTMELMGSHVDLKKASTLSNLLGKYVALLATQGSLALADTFLNDANEPSLVILKDRIRVSLGMSSGVAAPYQRVEVKGTPVPTIIPSRTRTDSQSSSVSQTFSRIGSSFNNNPAPTQQTTYQPQLFQPQQPAGFQNVPSYDSFYNPAGRPNSNQSYAPPPPPLQGGNAFLQPQTAPTPPPPPPPSTNQDQAFGSVSRKGGLSHRYPSRPHDPSVYSEPSYGQSSYSQQSYPGYNPAPQQFGGPVSPAALQGFQQQQAPPGGQQSYFSVEQSGFDSNTAHFASPPTATGHFVPTAPAPNQPLPACYGETKPGWNDPPPIKSSKKPSMAPAFQAPDSMMTPYLTPQENSQRNLPPLPASFPNQPPPSGAAVSFHNPPPFANPVPAFQPTQNLPPTGPTSYLGSNFSSMAPSQSLTQPQAVATPPPAPTPEPPKEKGPIPPENQILQDTLEDLRQQCQQKATNPQVRRKLDDVARKLETLYDKLRDDLLSSNTLAGLHEIARMIQQGDYQGSLSVHAQLVSTTNFAETSSFMLGLKVLLQTAQQLGVYLR